MRTVTSEKIIDQKEEIQRLREELEKVKKEKQQLENSIKTSSSNQKAVLNLAGSSEEKPYVADENLLHHILEVLPVSVFISDKKGNLAHTNKAAEKIWGGKKHYPLEKLDEYRGWWRETGKRLQADDWAFARAFLKGQTSTNEIIDIECFDGSRKTIMNFAAPVKNEKGKIIAAVAASMDITKRINAELALQKSEQNFRSLLHATTSVIYRMSADWSEMRELNSKGFISETLEPNTNWIDEYIHPADQDWVRKNIRKAIDSRSVFDLEHRVIQVDGSLGWTHSRAVPLLDEQGEIMEWLGIADDITERKQAEETLRRKVEENEKLMDILPAAVWISEDPGCNYMRGNRMANEFYEAEKDENVSANSSAARRFFIDGKETPAGELPMQKAAKTNRPVLNKVVDVLLPGGKMLHMHGSAIPLNDDKGKVRGSIAAFVDITEHVETKKALKESEEKFRLMANNISQLAWIADSKGERFWYNKRWLDYTGTKPEEMQGRGWEKLHHPDHVNRVVEKIQHSLDSGEIWEDVVQLRDKDEEYRWFLSRAVPLRDENNNIIRWFGTSTDVTEQKEYEELLKKNSELLENLMYITAHDLKGPIANMYMALNFIKSAPDEKKIEMIGQFRQQVDRLDKTIRGVTGILKVQKADETVAKTLYFESILNDILIEFKDKLQAGALEFDFSSRKTIRYIEPFLYSILKNLISNSIKYSRDDVALKIIISTQSENGYTLLTIKDNGIGMDMDKHGKQLFSPFRRFNPEKAKGTGVGLYIIKNIIEKNGGYIEVESSPCKGAAFYCYLKPYRQ